MKRATVRNACKQRGFSLIEMMVGLALGLVAVAVITQTAGVFEGQKSTTTSGVEAQENGMVALQLIQEDVKKAAGGFTNSTALICQSYDATLPGSGFFSYYHQPQAGVPPDEGAPADPGGRISEFSTTPVLIQDHTTLDNESSDRLTVISGRQFSGSAPIYLVRSMTNASDVLYVNSTTGFDIVDSTPDVYPLAIIARQGGNAENDERGTYAQCTLIKITGKSEGDLGGPILKHDNHLKTGSGVDADSPEYNPTDAFKAANNWPTYPSGSRIFRVGTTAAGGPGLISRTYRVANNKLVIEEGGAGTTPRTIEAVDGIVQIQAQYGIGPNENDAINDWVDAVDHGEGGANWAATPAAPLAANLKLRIKAIRFAIVARASKRDPAIITQPVSNEDCPNTGGGTNYGPCAWQGAAGDPAPAITLGSASDTEWQHYRYRVYQTVIPVRNVIWTH